MKIALISDTHFGIKNGSDMFLESQMRFFKEQFIPELKEKGIDTIIHMGDFWDNRNHINVKVKNDIYDLLENHLKDFKIYVLVGNHDTFYKTTIDVHSLQFLKKFDNITVVDKIMKVNEDGRDMVLVPWQVDDDLFIQKIANQNLVCEVAFGHFEISGFKFNTNRVCEDGISSDVFFNSYKKIFSGHFHTRSENTLRGSTISYIGSPYQLTRNDMNDKRGYTIFDTVDLSTEFVENTVSLTYVKLTYPELFNKRMIENNIVDIEITYDENYKEEDVQQYINTVESYKPVSSPIIKINNVMLKGEPSEFQSRSVSELIGEYIDTLGLEYKNKIYKKIMSLYEDVKGDSLE